MECFPTTFGVIDELPNQRFIKNEKEGQFYIVITGTHNKVSIQRVKGFGFERKQIKQIVGNYFMKLL